jgi:hypothetical protein
MTFTDRHQHVEAQFRELVAAASLPAPDDVAYQPGSVVFSWHGPKVAAVVDFTSSCDPTPPQAACGIC